LKIKQNVGVSNLKKTIAYIKRLSVCNEPKKSKTFTTEEAGKFTKEAAEKSGCQAVILMIRIYGAKRNDGPIRMNIDDV
jgi:hypothetical protein